MSPTSDSVALGAAPPPASAAPAVRVMYYCTTSGGIGRYTHDLLQSLVEQPGVDAELVCGPGFAWLNSRRYGAWSGLLEPRGASRWRRGLGFATGQFVNPRRLLRRAAATGAHVVHLSNINHLSFPDWSRRIATTGARLVATVHDVERAKPLLSRAYEDRQLRRFYRRADALFVHGRSQAAQLAAFADVDPGRIHVVPHGPYDYGPAGSSREAIRRRLQIPERRRVALFFGNIRDEKNLELMIRSLAAFGDDLHLLVAGRGDGGAHRPLAWYRELTHQLALGERVTFLDGYIPDCDVADLFVACDWVALPYSRRFTSQSGVLNVAMSYDRPVLAANTATLGETLCDWDVGVLAEPDSQSALVEGISRLHARLNASHPFGFAQYRRDNSWQENAHRTVSVYRALQARLPCKG